jgi:hypothetical protein
MLVPFAPSPPPGTAQYKARKGDELFRQQALYGVLAVGKRLGLLSF